MSNLQTLTPKIREARYPLFFDFTPLLKGQSIVSSSVSAINQRDNSAAAIVEEPVNPVSGGMYTVIVKDGVPGESYKITPSVELADGSIFEEDYTLEVVPTLRPLNILKKQEAEVIDAGIFFGGQLNGEEISSVSFLATDISGSSADVVDDRGFQNDLVSFRVRGGVHGQDYTVTVFVTTASGFIYTEQVLVRVRNK